MDTHILTALSSLLSILGIVYLLLWRFRVLCMDMFRQSMFELRDELFDYALAGHIDFDDPGYGVLRKTLNGYIRFAHQSTAWHGITLAVLLSREDKERFTEVSFDTVFEKSTAPLQPNVRGQLQRIRKRMDRKAFIYFALSCPELLILVLPLVLLLALVLGVLITISKVSEELVYRESQAISDCIKYILRLRKRWTESDNFALLYGEPVSR